MQVLRPFSNIAAPGPYQVPIGNLSIDWTNSLTSGLLSCFVPAAMGMADITTQLVQSVRGASQITDSFLRSTPEGPGMIGGSMLYVGAQYTGASAFTVWWRGYFLVASTNGGPGTFWTHGLRFDDPNGNPFNIFCVDTSASGSPYRLEWNTAGTSQGLNSSSPGQGVTDVVGTFVVNGTNFLYANGTQLGSISWGSGSPTHGTNPILSINGGTGNQYTNYIMTICGFWNRALSAAEIATLYLNPYGFLVPAEAEMPTVRQVLPTLFRKTLTPLGTRSGSRQMQLG